MKNSFAIDVKNLTKKFGKFMAVDSVELKVKEGEIFGILGPNGAGKTTTIRMLCGLLLPTSAEGTVNGFDIMKEPEEIKKSIGYVSQKFSLYDDLTLKENLNFYSGIYKVKDLEKKEEIIKALGLSIYKNKNTGELPLGIKQRLALACAIMHNPKILFLDEPTSGTDPVYRRSFWEIIYELSEKGTTIILTTHYLEEAEFCERVCLFFKGKIISEGSPLFLKERYGKASLEEVFISAIEENL
ncbi:MAG: ABC transporter ATP-binding protein [Thermoanaerobaculia bacterium]